MPSQWILCETRRFSGLAPLVEALRAASAEWPFTAAWLDLLASGGRFGRGVLHCGRWCEPGEGPASPPAAPARGAGADPGARVAHQPHLGERSSTRRSIGASGPAGSVVPPGPFFYPLDRVQSWNRLYGRRGMTQHQCVLPDADAAMLARFLGVVRAAGAAAFLVVLKDFGTAGEGLLSFPRRGLTVTLDFAVDERTPALVAALNREVVALGGRIYLAKDAFSTAEDFAAMEADRLGAFRAVQRRWDPEGRLRSRQAERLGLVEEPLGLGAAPGEERRSAVPSIEVGGRV